MPRQTLPVTLACSLLLAATIPPVAHAAPLRRHVARALGFEVFIPAGARVEDRSWAGGWVGMQAHTAPVQVTGATIPGQRITAWQMRAFAEQLSGIPHDRWIVENTYKARSGWTWYCTARAEQGDAVARAVYGVGLKGTFLLLLVTDVADARRSRAAYTRWTRTTRLR